jgi:hypothetical protein
LKEHAKNGICPSCDRECSRECSFEEKTRCWKSSISPS